MRFKNTGLWEIAAAVVLLAVGAGVIALMLSGCSAAPSKKELSYIAAARDTAPTCTSDAECKVMMSAAKAYLAERKYPPIQVDTPDELRTFERGGYWSIAFVAAVERKPIDADTWGIYAKFGMYFPGNAPVWDPKLYQVVVRDFNPYVKVWVTL
jgi:hypothetical protein